MALYAIGDLHLSAEQRTSPMEVFGRRVGELYRADPGKSLSQLTAEDVLVLAGDTSWGMSLEESRGGFSVSGAVSLPKDISSRATTITGGPPRAKLTAPFCEEQRLHHAGTAAQQLLFLRRSRRLRHPGLVFARRKQKPPQRARCCNRELLRLETSLKAAGDEAHLLLPALSAAVPGLCQCPEILALLEHVQGGALLLRPSPRAGDPPAGMEGKYREYGIFSDLRRTILGL